MKDKSAVFKVSINPNEIFVILYTLYLFWYIKPYFTWETYRNGVFNSIGGLGIGTIFLLCSLLLYIWGNKIIRLRIFEKNYLIALFMSGFLLIALCGGNFNNLFSLEWLSYLALALYVASDDKHKMYIYKVYITFFAITLIPAIIYYFVRIAGVSIPYTVLESTEAIKVDHGYSYYNYPFAVQLRHSINYLSTVRMCGIYDEGGKLGTLAALFLVSEEYQLKGKWKNIIILIAGVLSMSIAFYVMSLAYFVLKNFFAGKIRNGFLLLLIIVSYLVFINIPIQNESVANIQNRVSITANGLTGDNRANDEYDQIFERYLDSDPLTILFGMGTGAMGKVQEEYLIDGSSYKSLIYNYGIVGFIVSIIWVSAFGFHYLKYVDDEGKKKIFIILILYLLNLYQRPSVFYPPFIIITFGGIVMTRYNNKKFGGIIR